jgi:thiosulfate reductase cytochrome b subunit
MPRFLPEAAHSRRQKEAQEITTMQRFGFTLVLFGLALILGVVGMLLTDGMAPGRVPPGFAAFAAAGGGLLIVLGLQFLERGRTDIHRLG